MESCNYSFAALRGLQAGREYYVVICPLKVIPKIFIFDEEELPPNLRAQRILNKARIPEIARYIKENPKEYAFSSITASIDGQVTFEPMSENSLGYRIGKLTVPMSARFIIEDGQHRRAAIEEALKERPELGDETISVVFFIDAGLMRSQQMFADLNKHAIRPSKSLGILYDHRDPMAKLACRLSKSVSIFINLTELEKTTISNRSVKLFTLSTIYQATRALLKKGIHDIITEQDELLANEYWEATAEVIPDWKSAAQRRINTSELRRYYIHAHGLVLHAFGIIGASLLETYPMKWKKMLEKVKDIDWSRNNSKLWEGRAIVGGRVSKAHNNLILTTNVLKNKIGIKLNSLEKELETKFYAGNK